jgi:hypothetical protein
MTRVAEVGRTRENIETWPANNCKLVGQLEQRVKTRQDTRKQNLCTWLGVSVYPKKDRRKEDRASSVGSTMTTLKNVLESHYTTTMYFFFLQKLYHRAPSPPGQRSPAWYSEMWPIKPLVRSFPLCYNLSSQENRMVQVVCRPSPGVRHAHVSEKPQSRLSSLHHCPQ